MKQATIFETLHSYTPPTGWASSLCLLPEEAMHDIYQFVIDHQLHSCIELGTGFGATACVLGAAVAELGRGHVVTVDMCLHQPVNVKVLLDHTHLDHSLVEVDRVGRR